MIHSHKIRYILISVLLTLLGIIVFVVAYTEFKHVRKLEKTGNGEIVPVCKEDMCPIEK